MIPFNKPYATGRETYYISDAISSGKISGNGKYTQLVQKYFEKRWGFKKTLLTTSCTDALEMCALLLHIKPGDEVIMPSYTFVSTALAFVREGALIRFADSRPDHPGIDEEKIEALITSKTKAIIVVHYAGVACDMDKIMAIAARYNLFVIEDNAHGIGNFYKEKPLGSIGHLGCFSFHETKNIHCGEGGMLAINDLQFKERAEIIWEKGTNRAQFFRGGSSYYEWKDTGSSFLPSELNAAFLYAQIQDIDIIQDKRLNLWHWYEKGFNKLSNVKDFKIPGIPEYSTLNGNSFYLICRNKSMRDGIISHLSEVGIMALSHYRPLHKSEYYSKNHNEQILEMSEKYSDTILRFPLYHELTEKQVDEIINRTFEFLCKP